jgi:cephalosporin hydroxylase
MPKEISSTPLTADTLRGLVRASQVRHAGLIEDFHRAWYDCGHTWGVTYYQGRVAMKNPLDLWIAGEIIHQTKPTTIIETGTAFGGSALFFAHALDRLGAGQVLSIDIDREDPPLSHPRIRFMRGLSSVDRVLVDTLRDFARNNPNERIMVVLDSDHRAPHVAAELEAYAPLVTPGCFLVIEDTNMSGHPVPWDAGPGPAEAVAAWLPHHPEFEPDALAERYLLTMHPGGWLRRLA